MASYAGSPGMSAAAGPPTSIVTARALMYLGALLSLASFVAWFLPSLGSLKSDIRLQNPEASASTVNMLYGVSIGTGIVLGLVGTALWLWMAWKNGQGRSWARVLATLLFAANTAMAVATFWPGRRMGLNTLDIALAVALWIVGLVAVIFLWRSDSSRYYAATTAAQHGL